MRAADGAKLISAVETEGFTYTFLHYSDWEEIDDVKFHELRVKFEEAANELADFLGVEV